MAMCVDVSSPEGSEARRQVTSAVAGLQRTLRGPQNPLEALQALRHAQDSINRARDLLVLAARDEGHSWATIGSVLGVSRQAVWQADSRRRHHELERELDRQWRMPAKPRARRQRWFNSWRRAG